MRTAKWKTIIQILKWVKQWRDLQNGGIKTNNVIFETYVLFKSNIYKIIEEYSFIVNKI